MSGRERYSNIYFYIDNYTPDDVVGLLSLDWTYLIMREVKRYGGEMMRLEGYMELTKRTGPRILRKAVPSMRMYPREGTAQETSDHYKEDSAGVVGYHEIGTLSRQGTRTDLAKMRDMVIEKGMEETLKTFGARCTKMLREHLMQHEPSRHWKPRVIWLWGGVKTGRTNATKKIVGQDRSVFVDYTNAMPWAQYDHHKYIVIDNFTSSSLAVSEMIAILGSDEYIVNTDLGSRQLLAETIIITSNTHPVTYCKCDEENMEKLLEAIDEVRRA